MLQLLKRVIVGVLLLLCSLLAFAEHSTTSSYDITWTDSSTGISETLPSFQTALSDEPVSLSDSPFHFTFQVGTWYAINTELQETGETILGVFKYSLHKIGMEWAIFNWTSET